MSGFSVVALLAAYNEADIIEQVIRDLIDQRIDIYFIDDASTDGTAAIAERFVGRGVIGIDRRNSPHAFEWQQILERKAELARELDADWFIHHDADEFRESPWADLSLQDAIRRVDALGYNAIDFESFDFRPTHDQFRQGDDVRAAFPFCARRAPYDSVQIRCWKKTGAIDLASSGGHDAQFADRRVFPLRFILRHYPIRGQAHGERKIFGERRGRFLEEERARGWHVQYDDVPDDASFVRDPATLTRWDADAIRFELLLRHRGVEEAEAAAEASAREAAAEASAREAAGVRDRLNAQVLELTSSRAEAAAHRIEIDRLNEALRRQSADIERWCAVVDDLSSRLDAFQRSLSWRLTAPARAVYRVFLGGGS